MQLFPRTAELHLSDDEKWYYVEGLAMKVGVWMSTEAYPHPPPSGPFDGILEVQTKRGVVYRRFLPWTLYKVKDVLLKRERVDKRDPRVIDYLSLGEVIRQQRDPLSR